MRLCLRCRTTFGGGEWRCPKCGAEPEHLDGFPAFAPDLAHGAEGFDPAHFSELARLEADNFWFRARNSLIVWALERYFPGARNSTRMFSSFGVSRSMAKTNFLTTSKMRS